MDAVAPGPPDHSPPAFLDVPSLLESSQPKARVNLFWCALGGFLLVVLAASLLSQGSETGRRVVDALSAVLMVAVMAGMAAFTAVTVKKHRGEQQALEAAGELVQLRRWAEAAALLQGVLSRPARTPAARGQALIYLASVLARYHRFGDAIAVFDHLLDHSLVDGATAHGLRLGRAMAMLREDHLFDADRALAELRRTASTAGAESAGLALVEIYRDVKTGHPEEAVGVFEQRLPVMRDQLGHRVADAYVLAARAYDMLGRPAEAQNAYSKATLLAPPVELHRRYPEADKLAGRYHPSPAPPEAA